MEGARGCESGGVILSQGTWGVSQGMWDICDSRGVSVVIRSIRAGAPVCGTC